MSSRSVQPRRNSSARTSSRNGSLTGSSSRGTGTSSSRGTGTSYQRGTGTGSSSRGTGTGTGSSSRGTGTGTSYQRSTGSSQRRPRPSRRSIHPQPRIPVRRVALIIGATVFALVLFGFIFDLMGSFGRIHKGVTVQGVDVGGMTRAEAAAALETQLDTLVSSTPVDLFADEQLKTEGVNDQTVELTGASTSYNMSEGIEGSRSWRISPVTAGATIDGAALAEKAYAVGRGGDLFAGRLKAIFSGVDLEATLTYEPSQIATLESLIGGAIGWSEQNADISFVEGSFVVVPSKEGFGVDHNALVTAFDRAFLGTDRSLVVPMTTIPVVISDQAALEVAAFVQTAIEQPVALVYESEDSWSLDTPSLGSWIATSIEDADGTARLVPHIAVDRLETDIYNIIGDRDPGIRPQNARFEVVDDRVTIVPSVDGTGIDYARVAENLNLILFPAGDPVRDRRIALTVTTLAPALTTAQAEEMRITDKISTYTTEYTVASGAKVTNIHLAADLLNKSLIEPGGTWSFNGTAGECNAERGFQEATSIVGGEYVDEIGGGICQVATTVFNAAFDSGLPIAERVNHGFYLAAYPAGRDATVSWSWPDLKFDNDTGNWVLLTMSYTDNSVTCTLWGTKPSYRAETTDTGFTNYTDFETERVDNPELDKGKERVKQEGARGRTIVVTRYVYNSTGELIRKADFKSVYAPVTEIIEVGTKEPAADNGGTDGDGTSGTDGEPPAEGGAQT